MPAPLSAFVTIVFSRLLGRNTSTGRPDFSADGAAVEGFSGRFADFEMGRREDFRRGRAGKEADCRAVGRGFLFIRAEDSESDLEGTIILSGTGILPLGQTGVPPVYDFRGSRRDAYLPHRQDACATFPDAERSRS
jgi:hypothetical protein